jgi:lipid-binding SYLF domain-containing protein
LLIILSSQEAVNAFSSLAQISLGTELGIALGPLGRTAATDLHYSSSSSSSGGGTVGAGFCYAE